MQQETAPWPPRSLRVAVVVNRNARGVDRALVRRLQRIVPPDALFVSNSLAEMSHVARWIVHRRFDVVLCGGGDGTFARCVSEVRALTRATPAFGVLRLGTGNALADTLAAPSPTGEGLSSAVRRAERAESQREISLLRVGECLAPFAGFGADALILRDFNSVRTRLARTPLRFLGQGVVGYVVALLSRSLWRLIFRRRPYLTIRNRGATAWRLDAGGRPVGRPIPRGAILYEGPAILAAASTIPHYGFGFRLFPHADPRRRRFQLRVLNGSVLATLARLPAFCRGELVDRRTFDFICSAVSIEARAPTAFQIGGDEAGARTAATFSIDGVRAVWCD